MTLTDHKELENTFIYQLSQKPVTQKKKIFKKYKN
jgi:hypothetical protein